MEELKSSLDTGRERFLSTNLGYALAHNWITHQDLMRAFPPDTFMRSLESAPSLRTRLLVEVLGVHERIAPKKSTAACAEDLSIALAEGVATSADVFAIVNADECVRYFSNETIWSVLVSSGFWSTDDARARARMEFTLTRAVDETLISRAEIVERVGLERLAEDLPKGLLEVAFARAVKMGLSGSAFSPSALEDVVPRRTWLEHVRLDHVWKSVVEAQIIPALGVGSGSTSSGPKSPSAPPLPPSSVSGGAPPEGRESRPPGGPPPAPSSDSQLSTEDVESLARGKALASLTEMGRLPAHPEELSTPVLLSLDTMCSELKGLTTDEEREACIRDAFPNETLLEQALIALAEVLDPRLEREKLAAQGTGVDALIQIILFEEKRRARSQPSLVDLEGSATGPEIRGLVAPPPPTGGTRSAAPPPPLPSLSRGGQKPSKSHGR